MVKISNILGFSTKSARVSAHETHFGTIAYDEGGVGRHVIFKRNKYLGRHGEHASELEACFTAVANIYSSPSRVLRQEIVRDQSGKIVGVCSEHAAHALLRLRQSNPDRVFLPATSLQMTTLNKEVSPQAFQEWLQAIQINPLIPQPPPGPGEVEQNGQHKWATFKEETNLEDTYNNRLEQYWQERQRMDALLPGAEDAVFKACIIYSQDLLDKELPLDFATIPEKLIPSWELLKIVYEGESLKIKCRNQLVQNTQQELEISTLGVGKGFNFLDKMPQNFFARLLEAKDKGTVSIDMDSVADVFTTAYGLEEDDLHKGNIGFYITLENGRPEFHFFKIDHDLMFSAKLMSARGATRFSNISYTEHTFRITAHDLLHFPDLKNSGNHYWPTKRAIFVQGNKAYQSLADREAYKSLEKDRDFQKAKWMRFLKQTVVPNDFVVKCLKQTLVQGDADPEMASTLAVVQRATASRIAEQRIAMLQLPEFRDFLNNNLANAEEIICAEIHQYALKLGCTEQEVQAYEYEIKFMLSSMNVSHTSRTPLDIAISTKSYRCYETVKHWNKSLNYKDDRGLTALDHAIETFQTYVMVWEDKEENISPEQRAYSKKMLTYYADVINELDRFHVAHTRDRLEYEQIIEQVKLYDSIALLPPVNSLSEYKLALDDIRNQPLRTLKQDKICAVELLKNAVLSKEDLLQLRKELVPTEPAGPLKFIKELRSEIWIVKKIRGAYGATSTVNEIKELISHKLAALKHHQHDASIKEQSIEDIDQKKSDLSTSYF